MKKEKEVTKKAPTKKDIADSQQEFGSFILGEIWSGRLARDNYNWKYKGRSVHIVTLHKKWKQKIQNNKRIV